ncbi:hypothetical protein THMIRHAS_13010 [Thiosulfatimonas sediminis]|uniref:Xcc1710-like domain-containing protein n=1 Tax=Thiosulfatimonas sediminis TaxID=2675054 RepID=A0A6F8PV95_9GAMM|nr:Mth938-like domain-containing protein [Thiosulfatimonas sediminis]BBP45928.1 hypothetical protein THMIRHAS_13010 [Thiosulfatimonas sediminis]
MKFSEHRDSNINVVKTYQSGEVRINAQVFKQSLYFTQHEIFSDWTIQQIADLSDEHLQPIVALQPEVIILGTGEKQVFPDIRFFSYCACHGIGLEVMANDAACRTYNVLTTEDRDVVLALIFSQAETN